MHRSGLFAVALLVLVVVSGLACSPATYSTDVPIEFHQILREKYEGRTAWTRRTLQDEKKPTKIEQDQEVVIHKLDLSRSGAVDLQTPDGHTRIVFPFSLKRPITLEHYEKELLDVLWLTPPEERYEANKKVFGTRIADAIRDHRILPDMSQRHAYLAWGPPTEITNVVKRGQDEEWHYNNLNLKSAKIVFRSGKVAQSVGENIQDTEAARRRKNVRRGG
jgi:hypothetical protein